jgi:hypothetical protein
MRDGHNCIASPSQSRTGQNGPPSPDRTFAPQRTQAGRSDVSSTVLRHSPPRTEGEEAGERTGHDVSSQVRPEVPVLADNNPPRDRDQPSNSGLPPSMTNQELRTPAYPPRPEPPQPTSLTAPHDTTPTQTLPPRAPLTANVQLPSVVDGLTPISNVQVAGSPDSLPLHELLGFGDDSHFQTFFSQYLHEDVSFNPPDWDFHSRPEDGI